MHPNTSYDFTYNGGLRIDTRDAPFDVAYLLGVTNEHGQQLPDLNAVCNMVAEAIFLEIASPLGDTGRSILDNVEEFENSIPFPLRDGERVLVPTAFSSFAVASLNYPRDRIADYAAYGVVSRRIGALTQAGNRTPHAADGAGEAGELVKQMLAGAPEEALRLPALAPLTVDLSQDIGLIGQQVNDLIAQLQRQSQERRAVIARNSRTIFGCSSPAGAPNPAASSRCEPRWSTWPTGSAAPRLAAMSSTIAWPRASRRSIAWRINTE